jgi:hypothetical protein
MINNKSPLSSLTKTELRIRLTQGDTYVDVGRDYGVSRQAVYQKAQALGLSHLQSNLLEKRNQKIVNLRNRKVSVNEISRKFSLSTAQVYLILRMY